MTAHRQRRMWAGAFCLLLAGCSSAGTADTEGPPHGTGDASTLDGAGPRSPGPSTDAGTSVPDGTRAAPSTACEDVQVRIDGCGLHYSYPDFSTVCPGLLADGDALALEICAVKVCATFRLCLNDVLGIE